MENINKALVFLDKKVKKFSTDVQEAFTDMGNEGETSFKKEGSEIIGLDKEVAMESGKDVVAILDQEQGMINTVEQEVGLKNGGTISNFESREFKELSPQDKASKNIANNLAKIAEANPNEIANKIQQLTGITLNAGELINIVNDKQNKDVLELVSQELLKNFEFRIQEPTTADSFGFMVLDANNLTAVQRANFDFLRDLSMGQGFGSSIKNYSLDNVENKVIAYTKDQVGTDEVQQGLVQANGEPTDQEIKTNEKAKSEPSVYYAQSRSFTVNGSSKSFKLPDQSPIDIKAEERLARLKNEGVAGYKASRVSVQPNLSRLDNLKKPSWEASEKPVEEQFSSLANSSLDQNSVIEEAYSPDVTTRPRPAKPESKGPANNTVNFKRNKQAPEIDISSGKNNIKPFNRKNTAPIKTEINNIPSQAKSQEKLAETA